MYICILEMYDRWIRYIGSKGGIMTNSSHTIYLECFILVFCCVMYDPSIKTLRQLYIF